MAPEQKERRKEYLKAYKSTPEYKEWRKEYDKARNTTPEQKEHMRAWHKARKDTPEYKEKQRAWHKARKDTPEYKEKQRECLRRRKEADPHYKFLVGLRKQITMSITSGFKSGSSLNYLSESAEFYRAHLESLFQPGMTWENHGLGPGTWQLDHIKPMCTFDLTDQDQIKLAWHWTNLQPLWDEDHRIKTTEDLARLRLNL